MMEAAASGFRVCLM